MTRQEGTQLPANIPVESGGSYEVHGEGPTVVELPLQEKEESALMFTFSCTFDVGLTSV